MSTNKLATPYKQGLLGPGPQTIGGAKTFIDPGVFSVNSSSTALRITQAGAGNALVVEDSTTPDSTPFVIDATGTVGIGLTNPSDFTSRGIVVQSSISSTPGVFLWNTSSDTSRSSFTFRKDRSSLIVNSGDEVGLLRWQGFDGSSYFACASINGTIDAATAAGSMPGRLVFSTTPSGSTTTSERMRITSGGYVGINQATPVSQLHLGQTNGNADSGTLALDEKDTTPANPSSGNQAKIYLKADKFIIQYNDAGTVRYKYLDLTGTGVTWVHTTTAP